MGAPGSGTCMEHHLDEGEGDVMAATTFNKGGTSLSGFLVLEDREAAGRLSVGPDGLAFEHVTGGRFENLFETSWYDVTEIDVDGADALQSRVTVTRMFLVGLFAFALKKRTGDVYAYIQTRSGFHLVRVPKKTAPELRAFFAPYRSKMGQIVPGSHVVGPDQVPCPFCGSPIRPISIKCVACDNFVDGR